MGFFERAWRKTQGHSSQIKDPSTVVWIACHKVTPLSSFQKHPCTIRWCSPRDWPGHLGIRNVMQIGSFVPSNCILPPGTKILGRPKYDYGNPQGNPRWLLLLPWKAKAAHTADFIAVLWCIQKTVAFAPRSVFKLWFSYLLTVCPCTCFFTPWSLLNLKVVKWFIFRLNLIKLVKVSGI